MKDSGKIARILMDHLDQDELVDAQYGPDVDKLFEGIGGWEVIDSLQAWGYITGVSPSKKRLIPSRKLCQLLDISAYSHLHNDADEAADRRMKKATDGYRLKEMNKMSLIYKLTKIERQILELKEEILGSEDGRMK